MHTAAGPPVAGAAGVPAEVPKIEPLEALPKIEPPEALPKIDPLEALPKIDPLGALPRRDRVKSSIKDTDFITVRATQDF